MSGALRGVNLKLAQTDANDGVGRGAAEGSPSSRPLSGKGTLTVLIMPEDGSVLMPDASTRSPLSKLTTTAITRSPAGVSRQTPRKRVGADKAAGGSQRIPRPSRQQQPLPVLEQSIMQPPSIDKPVLKLFLKSSSDNILSSALPSALQRTANEASGSGSLPTMLRLRIGSGESSGDVLGPEELLGQSLSSSITSQTQSIQPGAQPNGSQTSSSLTPKAKIRRRITKREEGGHQTLEAGAESSDKTVKLKRVRRKRTQIEESQKTEDQNQLSPKTLEPILDADTPVIKPRSRKSKNEHSLETEFTGSAPVKKTRKPRRPNTPKESSAIPQDPENPPSEACESDDEVKSQAVKGNGQTAGESESHIRDEIVNEDFCAACKSPGYFICCETCPNSFHLHCLFPPLKQVPSEAWQCVECRLECPGVNTRPRPQDPDLTEAARALFHPVEGYPGLWEHVWARIVRADPVSFILPRRLRPTATDGTPSLELLDEGAYQVPQRRRASTSSEARRPPAGASSSSRRPNGGAARTSGSAVNGGIFPGPVLNRLRLTCNATAEGLSQKLLGPQDIARRLSRSNP